MWSVTVRLLLFQTLLSWCNARLVMHQNAPKNVDVEEPFDFDDIEQYLGLYSHGLVPEEEYEVVTPMRVTEDGAFVSHDLSANHDSISRHGARRKRAVLEGRDPNSVTEDEDEEMIHYNVTVGGKPLRLNLKPSHSFIGGALVVERHGPEGRTRERLKREMSSCHYKGFVAGQTESSVALSACRGLAGLLRTEHGEYWMEPSLRHTPIESGAAHPHVIYKRSAVGPYKGKGKGKGKCKGKGKGGKGCIHKKRRRRRGKHCATKEPPRQDLEEIKKDPQQNFLQTIRPWRANQNNNIRNDRRFKDADSKQRNQLLKRERQARSISRPRHVEVLLVADSTMSDFHQKGNVETYLLTIMNMVSSLYLDPTIGNFINVVVVKIILLDEQYLGSRLNITTNADTTLSNFCQWQRDLNPRDDAHPNHHDVAILITRKDICARQNVPCSTLGVAHVAGMCMPDRSCSVNEDNGITLAHTITHELGHNFGMYHDTEKIGCHRRVGSTLHVMTPIFEADTVEVAWSHCSRRDLTTFLDSGMGECLADVPAQGDYIYPELPAGALYDAGRQCRLQFGDGVDEMCTEMNEICQRIWCMINGTCTTMLRPAAPGTSCGEEMWCQNHECVRRSSPPPPEDGGWGNWSEWSECSRTCGGGVSITTRECDRPLPKFGGKFCTGERTRYQICNIEKCPSSDPPFRQVQCSKYDNKTYEGKLIPKWQMYFDHDEPCELYCSANDETIIVPFGQYAADGTPCNIGFNDMCISGICRKIGCDWVVDSNEKLDECGICSGNGSDCKQVKGIYVKKTTKESGFSEVALIPAGSKNIKIEEVANSKNFIGIVNARSRKQYFNGKRRIPLKGEYLVAGTPALYERDRDLEKVKIPGPIQEDILVFQMIYRGKYQNPDVRYQYTVDKPLKKKAEISYKWGPARMSPCTKSCGGGIIRQSFTCLNGTEEVDQEFCITNNDIEKPAEIMTVCNTQACPPAWWTGPWSQCPPCFKDSTQYTYTQYRRRKVMCKSDNKLLQDHECDFRIKPPIHALCDIIPRCNPKY